MYLRLLVERVDSLPFRTSLTLSLMSNVASSGVGQVKCGKGGGSCWVFTGHENGSSASNGTEMSSSVCWF